MCRLQQFLCSDDHIERVLLGSALGAGRARRKAAGAGLIPAGAAATAGAAAPQGAAWESDLLMAAVPEEHGEHDPPLEDLAAAAGAGGIGTASAVTSRRAGSGHMGQAPCPDALDDDGPRAFELADAVQRYLQGRHSGSASSDEHGSGPGSGSWPVQQREQREQLERRRPGRADSSSSPRRSMGRRSFRFAVPRTAEEGAPPAPEQQPRAAHEEGAGGAGLRYLHVSSHNCKQFQDFARELAARTSLECADVNPYVQALSAHRKELLRCANDLSEAVDSLPSRLATQRTSALATLSVEAPAKAAALQPSLCEAQSARSDASTAASDAHSSGSANLGGKAVHVPPLDLHFRRGRGRAEHMDCGQDWWSLVGVPICGLGRF